MADNSFLGVENAVNSSTTFRKNYTTATPSQQTGYEAANLRDEHLGLVYRGATADVGYTPLLARFDDTYNVGIPAALGHNLSPSAIWRATLDESYAVRPVWVADGVDDSGTTGETIPVATDFTLLARLYMPPPGPDHNTPALTTPAFIRMSNTGSGERFRISIRSDAVTSPLQIAVLTFNYSTSVIVQSTYRPRGLWVDIVYRYRASDDLVSLMIDGVSAGTFTASATLTGAEGDTKIEVASSVSIFTPVRFMAIHMYGRYMADTEAAAYNFSALDGTERDLLEGFDFLEGAGTTVAGAAGTSTLTLTGGAWADMANPSPAHSTGILEAIGQWYSRQALLVDTGTVATSPSLGTATRDITISFLLEVPDDFDSGTDEEIVIFGPSVANAELSFTLDSSGQVTLTSNRGTPDTITSSTVRGSGAVRVRGALKSVDSTESNLSLYLGTGTGTESLVGTVQVGPYDVLASCALELGDAGGGADNSRCLLSDVRLFSAERLESSTYFADNLLSPCNLSDPDLIESLRLDGDIVSDVDSSRAYTTGGIAYEKISNPNVTRSAPGREGLGYPYTSGREQVEAELIDFVQTADVEASEVFLEVWDRSNADGYVELGALCCWATVRPEENRISGAERTWKQRRALRTDVSGIPYLEDAWEALIGRIRLKYLNIIDEQDEVLRRVLRARRDKLACLVLEPTRLVGSTLEPVPQHLLVDHCVIGTLSASTHTIKEANNDRHVELDIEVEGVRRQTA